MGASIPWLAKAEGNVAADRTTSHAVGHDAKLAVVSNPYRHLLALAVHYATRQPERLVLRQNTGETFIAGQQANDSWQDDPFILGSPRALLMLDLPKESRLIPTALELGNGKVLTLYDDFGAKLKERRGAGSARVPRCGQSARGA